MISISVLFYFFITPEQLIQWIGVNNAYLLMFVLALAGGLTTFSGIPFHFVLITFAVGGMNPLLLGIAAGSGVVLGDASSYYLGSASSTFIGGLFGTFFSKIRDMLEKHPKLFPIICFIYGACVPFSNDFITVTAGVINYPFWRTIIPLGLGNLIFNIALAYSATYAFDIIQRFY